MKKNVMAILLAGLVVTVAGVGCTKKEAPEATQENTATETAPAEGGAMTEGQTTETAPAEGTTETAPAEGQTTEQSH